MFVSVVCKANPNDSLILYNFPQQSTRVEFVFEPKHNETIHRFHELTTIFRDAFSGQEDQIKSKRESERVFALNLTLRHPLYSYAEEHGRKFPFYVEPGDYLVVLVRQDGTLEYKMADGSPYGYQNLVKYDVSNTSLYGEPMFEDDKKKRSFVEYLNETQQLLSRSLLLVDSVANKYHFSEKERCIARCNTQMRYAFLIFEYTLSKSAEISIRRKNKTEAGWQSNEDDAELEEIENIRNYSFMRQLPLHDSTCLSSPYFPLLVQNYKYTHVLNHDQYLYYGETPEDFMRMDSVLVEREKSIINSTNNTILLDIVLLRRKAERDEAMQKMLARHDNVIESPELTIDTINGISLQEVEVWSQSLLNKLTMMSDQERLNTQLNNAQIAFNPLALVVWGISKLIGDRHKKKLTSKHRAQKIIEKMDKDDELREKLLKAYEEEMRVKR